MNPINHTAYYCCGARELDAQSSRPILGDMLATKFMNNRGRDIFNGFKNMRRSNMTSAIRSLVVENHIKKFLQINPQGNIILIGAGFDTKAFRMQHGTWFEIDEPGILNHKEKILPSSSCSNKLTRFSHEFAQNNIAEIFINIKKQNNFKNLFVIEGVFMYLSVLEVDNLLENICRYFGEHDLVCDLMNHKFMKKNLRKFQEEIEKFNCFFKLLHNKPISLFTEKNYKIESIKSLVEELLKLRKEKIMYMYLKLFGSYMFDGYSVYYLSNSRESK